MGAKMSADSNVFMAKGAARSRTKSIAFVALTIAIMAVCAWVTVPIGPVPITLQMFGVSFAILALRPKECVAAVAGYLALGALGVPVFSSMRGGLGVLMGPTGGYLIGYLLGAALAVLALTLARKALKLDARAAGRGALAFAVELVCCLLFVAVSYLCGWAQFMAVTGTEPMAAFLATVAPFVVLDFIKVAVAVLVARAVRAAVG